jgi:hypothetical protein
MEAITGGCSITMASFQALQLSASGGDIGWLVAREDI